MPGVNESTPWCAPLGTHTKDVIMEKETYVVVRIADSYDPYEAFSKGVLSPGARPAAGEAATLIAESAELDRAELQEMRRDDTVLGAAPALPVQLIKPVADTSEDSNPDPSRRHVGRLRHRCAGLSLFWSGDGRCRA